VDILDKLDSLLGNFQIIFIKNCWTVVRAVILSSMTRKVMDCCLTLEISDVGDCVCVIETNFFVG